MTYNAKIVKSDYPYMILSESESPPASTSIMDNQDDPELQYLGLFRLVYRARYSSGSRIVSRTWYQRLFVYLNLFFCSWRFPCTPALMGHWRVPGRWEFGTRIQQLEWMPRTSSNSRNCTLFNENICLNWFILCLTFIEPPTHIHTLNWNWTERSCLDSRHLCLPAE